MFILYFPLYCIDPHPQVQELDCTVAHIFTVRMEQIIATQSCSVCLNPDLDVIFWIRIRFFRHGDDNGDNRAA